MHTKNTIPPYLHPNPIPPPNLVSGMTLGWQWQLSYVQTGEDRTPVEKMGIIETSSGL
jgi:hypothetical protein